MFVCVTFTLCIRFIIYVRSFFVCILALMILPFISQHTEMALSSERLYKGVVYDTRMQSALSELSLPVPDAGSPFKSRR